MCIGVFVGALEAVRSAQPWILGLLLWSIFLIWQFAPVLFEGYSPGVNFREIARYPVSFRGYYLLNCVYGLADPAAAASTLWLACIWLAVLIGKPEWSLTAAGVLLAFVVFNVFCNRLVIGLLERFQSTRRGRERMAIVLLFLMITPQMVQLIGFNWQHMEGVLPGRSLLLQFASLNHLSPPGAALQAMTGEGTVKLAAALLLLLYLALAGLLLRRHARAVYRGEVHADSARAHRELKVRPGWKVPGLDDTISAVMEKEFCYLRQNSRVLVQIIYPLIIFAIFFSSRGATHKVFTIGQGPTGMLAILAGFLLLSVANMAYNVFGLDREGFGRWMLAPIRLQNVLLAKNLTQAVLFTAMYAVAGCMVMITSRTSLLSAITVTVSFFTVLVVQLGAGNLFSVYWPKNIDLTRMNSRMVSNAAGYASFLVIGSVGLVGGLVALASVVWNLPWLPLAASVVILCVVIRLYFYSLDRAAEYVQNHIEEIEQTLSK
jgi:ABC-2 type transport system permease protein